VRKEAARLPKLKKFGGLIVNEYVKILCKVSTKILLIAVIIVAAGFNALMYVGYNMTNNWSGWHSMSVDDYIRMYEGVEGMEREVEKWIYIRDNEIDLQDFFNAQGSWYRSSFYYSYRDESADIWRARAVHDMFELKYIIHMDEIIRLIESGELERSVFRQRMSHPNEWRGGGYDDYGVADEDEEYEFAGYFYGGSYYDEWEIQRYAVIIAEIGSLENISEQIEMLDAAIKNRDWKEYYKFVLGRAGTDENSVEAWRWEYKIINNIAPGDWKDPVVDEAARYKISLAEMEHITEYDDGYAQKMLLINSLAIAEHRLENNIERYTFDGIDSMNTYVPDPGFWNIFAVSTMTVSIISVLIIVIAGGLLSSEFSAGTVKFLLINPVKRWKIVAAKYISVLSITLAAIIALYIFNMIFAGVFFGFRNFTAPYLSAHNGEIITGSSFIFVLIRYFLASVGMVCMATFAFALSSLVRNSALAIGLGVFLFLSGNIVVQVLSMLGLYQAKYILFANTNLISVINGQTGFINHTLTFALTNIAVYMIVFLWTAWDGFVRNDVK
jgi:ABC-2 type transport system permease protein